MSNKTNPFSATIFLLLISTVFCFGQKSDLMLVPFEEDGRWGYMNLQKEVIVQAIYEEAFPTYNLRGRVKKKGKYGFIDNQGKLVIKCKYDEAEDFIYGISKVVKSGEAKYIKRNGKKNKRTIALCGTHGSCFHPLLNPDIIYKNEQGKYGFITKKRNHDKNIDAFFLPDTIEAKFDTVIAVTHQLMFVRLNGKFSFIHDANFHAGAEHVLKELDFIYEDFLFFNCDFCSTGKHRYIGVKQNGLWGIAKVYLVPQLIVEPKYHAVSSLATGYGLVEFEKGKSGYIDQKGNEYFFKTN